MAVETNLGELTDIPVFAGEDRTLSFTVYDEDGEAGGVVEDITGWALLWEAGTVSLTTGGGQIIITSGTGGLCEATLSAADTTTLEGVRTPWRLRRTDSGLNVVVSFGLILVQS